MDAVLLMSMVATWGRANGNDKKKRDWPAEKGPRRIEFRSITVG